MPVLRPCSWLGCSTCTATRRPLPVATASSLRGKGVLRAATTAWDEGTACGSRLAEHQAGGNAGCVPGCAPPAAWRRRHPAARSCAVRPSRRTNGFWENPSPTSAQPSPTPAQPQPDPAQRRPEPGQPQPNPSPPSAAAAARLPAHGCCAIHRRDSPGGWRCAHGGRRTPPPMMGRQCIRNLTAHGGVRLGWHGLGGTAKEGKHEDPTARQHIVGLRIVMELEGLPVKMTGGARTPAAQGHDRPPSRSALLPQATVPESTAEHVRGGRSGEDGRFVKWHCHLAFRRRTGMRTPARRGTRLACLSCCHLSRADHTRPRLIVLGPHTSLLALSNVASSRCRCTARRRAPHAGCRARHAIGHNCGAKGTQVLAAIQQSAAAHTDSGLKHQPLQWGIDSEPPAEQAATNATDACVRPSPPPFRPLVCWHS